MALSNLKNKITAIRAFDWEAEAIGIVERHKEDIADLQAEQLAKGKNRKGEDINPQYSDYTIELKKQKQGLAGIYSHVTYFDTGDLYKSLYTQIEGKKFSLQSESFKFEKMIKRSGQNVVGLDLEMRKRFVEEVTRPEMAGIVKQKLGINIK
ncbi:MAG: hypothetical protein JWQ09_2988 [Segetibacter sp.]|nr:hypothetical protein [Segetibacter sp.]